MEFIDHLDAISLSEYAQTNGLILDSSGYSSNGSTYAALKPFKDDMKAITSILKSSKPPFKINDIHRYPHVTVIYSRNNGVDVQAIANSIPYGVVPTAKVIGVEYWPGHDREGYIVLKLKSRDAEDINTAFVAAGARHSFSDYTPHMTIEGDVGSLTPELEAWMKRFEDDIKYIEPKIRFSTLEVMDIRE